MPYQKYIPSPRRAGRPDWLEHDQLQGDIAEAVRMGLSDRDAAIRANVSDRTIFRYRRKHGIPPNGRRGVRRPATHERQPERSTR